MVPVQERSFPSIYRLRSRRDFLAFTRCDPFVRTDEIVVQWKKTTLPVVRLGITMAKKFGRAVDRVRFRRYAREAFRHSQLRQMQGFDIHVRVVARGKIGFHDLEKLFSQLVEALETEDARSSEH